MLFLLRHLGEVEDNNDNCEDDDDHDVDDDELVDEAFERNLLSCGEMGRV